MWGRNQLVRVLHLRSLHCADQYYFFNCLPLPAGYFIREKLRARHCFHEKRQLSQRFTNLKNATNSVFPCISAKNFHLSADTKQKASVLERLVNKCPPGIQPYLRLMRIDKPTGTLLLLWPCYWSLAMASYPSSFPDPTLLALFGCGAFLMRGAGCTINDLWDKDLDSKVLRTMNRPLARGEISVLDAVMFLGGQLSLALFILLCFNWYSIILGSASLLLVTIYPLMKRITYYPQFVLGLTFNWGALLGWAVLRGSCDWPVVLPLYAACIFWTMIYDTIYAHQDRVDDVLVKIKSTALKFGDDTKLWLTAFAAISASCFTLSGYVAGQTWPYYVSISAAATTLMYQIISLNIHDPKDCFEKFRSNHRIGWIIFLGVIGGTFAKHAATESQVPSKNTLQSDGLHTSALHLT